MPPWGGRDARLGNNPVIFAIPHGDTPVLVDVAIVNVLLWKVGKLCALRKRASGRRRL